MLDDISYTTLLRISLLYALELLFIIISTTMLYEIVWYKVWKCMICMIMYEGIKKTQKTQGIQPFCYEKMTVKEWIDNGYKMKK